VQEKFEDTKGVIIIICISKKNRQHNGQKKKYKRTNNDTKYTHKTKDRVTRTPLKTGGELRFSILFEMNKFILVCYTWNE